MPPKSPPSARPRRAHVRADKLAPGRRVRLQLDQRRAHLIELGIDLFTKHGYEDFSIDDVAKEARISKGLFYHYFRSKRDFYVATVRASSRRLQLLTMPDPALPPAAQLRAAVDAHLRYIQEHGAVYAAVYRSGVAIAPEIREILEEHRGVITRYFLQALGIEKPRPIFRSAIRAWIAMVEGASLDWIADRAISRDELRELLVASYVALMGKTMEMAAHGAGPHAGTDGDGPGGSSGRGNTGTTRSRRADRRPEPR